MHSTLSKSFLLSIIFAVLTFCANSAFSAPSKNVIYDSTGGAENGGDSFASAGGTLVDQVYNQTAGVLDRVALNLGTTKIDAGIFDVVLTKVRANGLPGKRMIIATISDSDLLKTFSIVTAKPSTTVSLAANTYYYVGIARHANVSSKVTLGNALDPLVSARPTVVAGKFYYNNGGVQANSGGPYEITVYTH